MNVLRVATRQLGRNPAFSAIVVLTLALGFGASALIYSVIDGVLLEPLPYTKPNEIVRVFQVREGNTRMPFSDPNFTDLKEQTHSFSAFAQFVTLTESVAGGSEPVRVQVSYVTAEFRDALGVTPIRGRWFVPEEQRYGAPPVTLISYR